MKTEFQKLPAVHELAKTCAVPDELALSVARQAIATVRKTISDGAVQGDIASLCEQEAKRLLESLQDTGPQAIVNATGTVLHTGLGRAPLSKRAQAAVNSVLNGYCDLEFDVPSGKRGNRLADSTSLLCALTGAEDALVVNNCAGAAVLILQCLAQGREVLVSRGELVEIGGSFRVPEVMASAGCLMKEVGATNKTHLRDYADAISEQTDLLLKVHRSNFIQEGFVAEVSLLDLVELGAERGVPVALDQGSGCMVDLSPLGIQTPMVQTALASGIDVLCCSGDKLFGGPQAGIILGKRSVIERCRQHPLARALRVDKLTVAALTGTLHDYLFDDPWEHIPTLQALITDVSLLQKRAEHICSVLDASIARRITVEQGQVGSGAAPTQGQASVQIRFSSSHVDRRARSLRTAQPPIIPRIADGELIIDLGTVAPTDDELLISMLHKVFAHE